MDGPSDLLGGARWTEPTKYLDLREFRDAGYLQEVNRRFLHRLGLALCLSRNGTEYVLYGIWDARDDPEGIIFHEAAPIDPEKVERIDRELQFHDRARQAQFGWMIQPPVIRNG